MSLSSVNFDLSHDIQLAQEGNHQAFARLIKTTSNMVSSIALAIVKDLDNSEDVAQQVYIGAWQQLDTLKSHTSFLPWLRQMTRYKAFNFLRDNKITLKAKNDEADQVLAQFCDPNSHLDIALHKEQQSFILSTFIDKLPEESREIVLLYYREEQNSAQVAQLLDQKEASIRKKLSRVRLLLQEKILAKHGRLLLTTAPSAGLISFVLGALTTSTPAAASVITSSVVKSQSGILSKFIALLGGSLLGGITAIIAIRISTFWMLKKMTNVQARQHVANYQKNITLWIIFGSVLLTCSYEFTQGWWGPVTAYLVFAVGVIYHVNKMQNLINQTLNEAQQRLRRLQHLCSFWGSVLGMSAGFTGLLIGLTNSGRLLL